MFTNYPESEYFVCSECGGFYPLHAGHCSRFVNDLEDALGWNEIVDEGELHEESPVRQHKRVPAKEDSF